MCGAGGWHEGATACDGMSGIDACVQLVSGFPLRGVGLGMVGQ